MVSVGLVLRKCPSLGLIEMHLYRERLDNLCIPFDRCCYCSSESTYTRLLIEGLPVNCDCHLNILKSLAGNLHS